MISNNMWNKIVTIWGIWALFLKRASFNGWTNAPPMPRPTPSDTFEVVLFWLLFGSVLTAEVGLTGTHLELGLYAANACEPGVCAIISELGRTISLLLLMSAAGAPPADEEAVSPLLSLRMMSVPLLFDTDTKLPLFLVHAGSTLELFSLSSSSSSSSMLLSWSSLWWVSLAPWPPEEPDDDDEDDREERELEPDEDDEERGESEIGAAGWMEFDTVPAPLPMLGSAFLSTNSLSSSLATASSSSGLRSIGCDGFRARNDARFVIWPDEAEHDDDDDDDCWALLWLDEENDWLGVRTELLAFDEQLITLGLSGITARPVDGVQIGDDIDCTSCCGVMWWWWWWWWWCWCGWWCGWCKWLAAAELLPPLPLPLLLTLLARGNWAALRLIGWNSDADWFPPGGINCEAVASPDTLNCGWMPIGTFGKCGCCRLLLLLWCCCSCNCALFKKDDLCCCCCCKFDGALN